MTGLPKQIETSYGTVKYKYDSASRKTYYLLPNGIVHREDGPAIISDQGLEVWCNNGDYHRLDGPAVIYPSGHMEWYINDFQVTTKIQKWAKERDIDLNNLTEEDKMAIKFEWGNYGK